LKSRKHTDAFFSRIRELNLEPKLILFPRNQPQWINSSYASTVKSFRRSDPFQSCALNFAQSVGSKFFPLARLGRRSPRRTDCATFNKETVARGVIPLFLGTIGINSSRFRDRQIRRNEAVGPFTVSVARDILRSIDETIGRLTWLQARRCKVALAGYLGKKGLADAGYCGLTTTLARRMEQELRSDNDAFAQRVWANPGRNFCLPILPKNSHQRLRDKPARWFTARRLRRAVREVKESVHELLLDPVLAVEAPWNDVRQRSGLVSEVATSRGAKIPIDCQQTRRCCPYGKEDQYVRKILITLGLSFFASSQLWRCGFSTDASFRHS